MINDNYLKHYGILGMHWGHRKGSSTVTKSRKPVVTTKNGKYYNKNSQEVSGDAAKSTLIRQKKVREMSNADLRSLNERLQLERQFNELKTNERQQKVGLNYVKEVTAVGTTFVALYGLSKSPLGQAVEKLIKSKL